MGHLDCSSKDETQAAGALEEAQPDSGFRRGHPSHVRVHGHVLGISSFTHLCGLRNGEVELLLAVALPSCR